MRAQLGLDRRYKEVRVRINLPGSYIKAGVVYNIFPSMDVSKLAVFSYVVGSKTYNNVVGPARAISAVQAQLDDYLTWALDKFSGITAVATAHLNKLSQQDELRWYISPSNSGEILLQTARAGQLPVNSISPAREFFRKYQMMHYAVLRERPASAAALLDICLKAGFTTATTNSTAVNSTYDAFNLPGREWSPIVLSNGARVAIRANETCANFERTEYNMSNWSSYINLGFSGGSSAVYDSLFDGLASKMAALTGATVAHSNSAAPLLSTIQAYYPELTLVKTRVATYLGLAPTEVLLGGDETGGYFRGFFATVTPYRYSYNVSGSVTDTAVAIDLNSGTRLATVQTDVTFVDAERVASLTACKRFAIEAEALYAGYNLALLGTKTDHSNTDFDAFITANPNCVVRYSVLSPSCSFLPLEVRQDALASTQLYKDCVSASFDLLNEKLVDDPVLTFKTARNKCNARLAAGLALTNVVKDSNASRSIVPTSVDYSASSMTISGSGAVSVTLPKGFGVEAYDATDPLDKYKILYIMSLATSITYTGVTADAFLYSFYGLVSTDKVGNAASIDSYELNPTKIKPNGIVHPSGLSPDEFARLVFTSGALASDDLARVVEGALLAHYS